MSTVLDRLPCFPCFNCHTYAFATKVLFLLTLLNIGLFVGMMLHLNGLSRDEKDDHFGKLLHQTNANGTTTSEDWDIEEKKADILSYSNIWFVLTPGIYAIMVAPDYAVNAEGFVQLRSINSRTRGLGILAMCVTVCLMSTFKHAFESSNMYPADLGTEPNDPLKDSDPNSTNNRIYCQLHSSYAYAALIRGDRSAAWVYACLPAYWALKLDWLVARVSIYTIAFMASGFPEAAHVLWAKKRPHWHALVQTLAFGGLGACVLMDIIQTVQSTNKSAMHQAIDSVIWSTPAVAGPWLLLSIMDETASAVAAETLRDPHLNLKSRTLLLLLNVAMGYVAWDYPDDKFRLAHMAWHFFSGVAALCALTLTVDWEGRFTAYQERVASELDGAARGEQRQSSKRGQVAIKV